MFNLCQHHKIFKLIVVFNSVDVMNMLVRFKNSAIRLFPDAAMLAYVTLRIGVRVVRHMQDNIAVYRATPTSSPAMVILAQLFGPVARQQGGRITAKMSLCRLSAVNNPRFAAATAFTDSGRNILWTGNDQSTSANRFFAFFRPMARNEPYGPIFVFSSRFNGAATAAFT